MHSVTSDGPDPPCRGRRVRPLYARIHGFLYGWCDGANLGGFKARAHGIGPVLSYAAKIAGQDLIAELKWLHEFDNRNRLEGDTIFFKVLTKF